MSIVSKLTSVVNFFNLKSKKRNWGGQTLSYSYRLLCPASILPQKHTLCYNAVQMVGFEQFFMNLELCTCKYNPTPKLLQFDHNKIGFIIREETFCNLITTIDRLIMEPSQRNGASCFYLVETGKWMKETTNEDRGGRIGQGRADGKSKRGSELPNYVFYFPSRRSSVQKSNLALWTLKNS